MDIIKSPAIAVLSPARLKNLNMNCKPISLLLIAFFIVFAAAAQNKIYQIKADSVRIFSNCDTAELILENRTRNLLNSVLTNKGNGVTEFKKVMVKLND